MATDPIKQDGSATGLRYTVEDSFGVVDGSQDWITLEPNSYDTFGPVISTVARQPINELRQNRLGVVSDIDANASFETDFTQSANVINLFQGFFFKDFTEEGTTLPRNASQITMTGVTTAPDTYTAASGLDGLGIVVDALIFAEGFTDPANNGLKVVTTVAAGVIGVAETLVTDGAPASASGFSVVGYQFEVGTLDIAAPGGVFVSLTRASGVVDFTTLGLRLGQWIWIGGDATDSAFDGVTNNGLARVVSVTTTVITLDRTDGTMIAEVGADETIQIFFSDQLNNATVASDIVRRTYQLERLMGADDTDTPAELQSEYVVGAAANELTFNIPATNKVTLDWSFLGKDHETRTGAVGEKAGTRPTLGSFDGFGTTGDVNRIRINAISTINSNPSLLTSFVQDITVAINNNIEPNKAVTVLGAFELSTGQFEVSGSMTAYFAKNDALDAIRNNTSVGIDVFMVKGNAGMVLDMPLVTLAGGPAAVELNAPITLPLTYQAVQDGTLNYTMSLTAFKFLPDAAAAAA